MSKLTLDVPGELKTIIDRHPDIPWERVASEALWTRARKLELADGIASRSALTEAAAETIDREIKAGLRRRYAK